MRFAGLFILLSLSFVNAFGAYKYPAHWWKYVDPSEASSWEILPQDAGPNEVILSKRNELGILSNFAHTPFIYKGLHYESLEGFWQSLKYPENEDDIRNEVYWAHTREEVQNMVGFTAKKAGSHANYNMKDLGISWVTFKNKKYYPKVIGKGEHYYLIKDAIRTKIEQNPEVKRILKATGDLYLRADHDIKWYLPPAWSYNKIYMEIRDEMF